MRRILLCIAILALLCTAACVKEAPKSSNEENFTLGMVQKNIRVGMAQAEVAELLEQADGTHDDQDRDPDGREGEGEPERCAEQPQGHDAANHKKEISLDPAHIKNSAG